MDARGSDPGEEQQSGGQRIQPEMHHFLRRTAPRLHCVHDFCMFRIQVPSTLIYLTVAPLFPAEHEVLRTADSRADCQVQVVRPARLSKSITGASDRLVRPSCDPPCDATRRGLLPDEQREGIRTYVSNVIINICKDPAAFRAQHVFLNKVNIILVQILKHDWPNRWRSFIPDLVAASKV